MGVGADIIDSIFFIIRSVDEKFRELDERQKLSAIVLGLLAFISAPYVFSVLATIVYCIILALIGLCLVLVFGILIMKFRDEIKTPNVVNNFNGNVMNIEGNLSACRSRLFASDNDDRIQDFSYNDNKKFLRFKMNSDNDYSQDHRSYDYSRKYTAISNHRSDNRRYIENNTLDIDANFSFFPSSKRALK